MTHPTTVNEALRQTKALFPGATLLFATDGVRVIGSAAEDDPGAIVAKEVPEGGLGRSRL